MINITNRKVTTIRHEYVVLNPATARGISDAIFLCKQDMERAGRDTSYDDSYMISGDESEIIVYWTETEKEVV